MTFYDKRRYSVAIVLEGNEEESLFRIAESCHGVSDVFDLISFNAGGQSAVPVYFQQLSSDPSLDCVVTVYDVDNGASDPKSPYSTTRRELLSILGDDDAVSAVSFCTNPNILQILLMGCGNPNEIGLVSTSKSVNASIVEKYWPQIRRKSSNGKIIKRGYDASEWQLRMIEDSYLYEGDISYKSDMLLRNSGLLNVNYEKAIPASNVQNLLTALKDGNIDFFESINKRINR